MGRRDRESCPFCPCTPGCARHGTPGPWTAGGAFIAALLTLTGMVWLTQILRRFDLVTSQGQTILMFFTVTGLALPTLIQLTAPMALFLAITYTLNKLNGDSELIVMSAAGFSQWQLLRPLF